VATRAMDRPSALSLQSLAIVAPCLVQLHPGELTKRVSEALDVYEGGSVVVGAGIAMVGPIDVLTQRRRDGPNWAMALEQAAKVCQSAGVRSLAVRYWWEAASVTGIADYADAARALAEGTDLEALLV